MPIVKWIKDPADVKGMNAKWLEKYKAKNYSASNMDDILLFFGGMAEFGLENKEYKQVVDDAVEQYREICQYYEIRGTDIKLLIIANEQESKSIKKLAYYYFSFRFLLRFLFQISASAFLAVLTLIPLKFPQRFRAVVPIVSDVR